MTAIEKPVLVLGAGINGAAIARELVLNRVPVCVVDTADLAGGTTAYSSRLIHGGLRYLEFGEFSLVRESLGERTRLLKLAPHLVRPLRLFIPGSGRFSGLWQSARRFLGWSGSGSPVCRGSLVVRMGLRMYDRYARDKSLPAHGVHRPGAADTPPVAADYEWLCSYFDAQVEFPERLVVALLRDARVLAEESGIWFRVRPWHRASLGGRTVEMRSTRPGNEHDVRSHHFEPSAIINATGAWLDQTLAQLHVPSRRLIGGTKGSHFFTRHAGLRSALNGNGIYAEANDGRPVFLLPLAAGTLVGTTDIKCDDPPEQVVASEQELAYLLAASNRVFPQLQLTPDDIDWHYAGVRPLPFTDDGRSAAAVTRRHWIETHRDGPVPMYSIVGGKLTTCRSLAEQAVAKILPDLGQRVAITSRDRPVPDTVGLETADEPVGGESPPNDAAVVPGLDLAVGRVRQVIRSEWVTTLPDLVERRLMLMYGKPFSRVTLESLADVLREERTGAADAGRDVAECVERLRVHFGKVIR